MITVWLLWRQNTALRAPSIARCHNKGSVHLLLTKSVLFRCSARRAVWSTLSGPTTCTRPGWSWRGCSPGRRPPRCAPTSTCSHSGWGWPGAGQGGGAASSTGRGGWHQQVDTPITQWRYLLELQTIHQQSCTITEKAPTRARLA